MKIKQISLFLENRAGQLLEITKILAENGITDPREAELYVGLMSAETMEDIVSGTGTFRIG